jgi:anti-sigma factor RsiW
LNHEECHHLLGSLSEYIDGTLEETLCREIKKHMGQCERCRIVVDSMNKTIYLYQSLDAGQSVPNDVRQRLFKRLDLDDLLHI